jgi:hypothetical protein
MNNLYCATYAIIRCIGHCMLQHASIILSAPVAVVAVVAVVLAVVLVGTAALAH